jgi:GNAT superfamily N-acetyltransferase
MLTVEVVAAPDLPELLPMLRGYCDFYREAPSDEELLAVCRALAGDPEREGLQLLARAEDGRAVGFATLLWTWSLLRGGRVAVMNDLFVAPGDRRRGLGGALIAACREHARERGALWLGWQTAKDNVRAQRVYEAAGALREEWLDYGLRP